MKLVNESLRNVWLSDFIVQIEQLKKDRLDVFPHGVRCDIRYAKLLAKLLDLGLPVLEHVFHVLLEFLSVQLAERVSHLVCGPLQLGNVYDIISLLHHPALPVRNILQGYAGQVQDRVVVAHTRATLGRGLGGGEGHHREERYCGEDTTHF